MLVTKEQGRVFWLLHKSPCGLAAQLAPLVTCISIDMLLLPVLLRKLWLSLLIYPRWCFKVTPVVIFKSFDSVLFSSRILYCLASYICISRSYISNILKFFFIFIISLGIQTLLCQNRPEAYLAHFFSNRSSVWLLINFALQNRLKNAKKVPIQTIFTIHIIKKRSLPQRMLAENAVSKYSNIKCILSQSLWTVLKYTSPPLAEKLFHFKST